MEFLGTVKILEVGYVQAQTDETNSIHRQGMANKNSGRFGAVQYLKRPLSLHGSAKRHRMLSLIRTSNGFEPI